TRHRPGPRPAVAREYGNRGTSLAQAVLQPGLFCVGVRVDHVCSVTRPSAESGRPRPSRSTAGRRQVVQEALLVPLLGLARAVVHGRALAAVPLVDVNRPFEEQRSTILAQLNDGTTSSEISADDRRRVVSSLNRISGLLDNREASELPEATRVEVFNEQIGRASCRERE